MAAEELYGGVGALDGGPEGEADLRAGIVTTIPPGFRRKGRAGGAQVESARARWG